NAILPFETKNAVQWNPNYMGNFTAERRNANIDDLDRSLRKSLLSIGRSAMVSSVREYNGGVNWEREAVYVHGTRWISTYLPVWIYSYEADHAKPVKHYIAVNGRTGRVMGSVPISYSRIGGVAFLISLATDIVIFLGGLGFVSFLRS
ncbi:MAG: TFIIB-type zinc ribbon-containing protein, partial [Microbacteriaceae bacterium]|nr:TFIIB-type zinc ribbon-containing protein [Microbacteriaceae bacterium]